MNRRQFAKFAAFSGFIAPVLAACQKLTKADGSAKQSAAIDVDPNVRKNQAEAHSKKGHEAFMADPSIKMMGEEHIVMLLYPGFAALDLVGPQYLLATMMGAKIYLIAPGQGLAPVKSGEGLLITPTHAEADCPRQLDMLFVPGGASGTLAMMKSPAFIDFIKQQAGSARYLTSVCTGSMLLGKAGLLAGKKATSHWLTLNLLAKFGAIPVSERVVWDGNLVTGGGVTAGIDFGLEIVAALRGRKYAEASQLQAEYNPAPPFASGSPDQADPFVRDNLLAIYEPFLLAMELAI